MHLDALAVNQGVLNRDGGLRWWQYNYQALEDFKSPEPEAFGGQTGSTSTGVYLHWSLPQALRHGTQDISASSIDYPLVPNRWLVVRTAGTETRTTTAWVIESDLPFTSAVQAQLPDLSVAQMSMYLVDPKIIDAWKSSTDSLRNSTALDSNSNSPQVANIGVPFPLADGWSERSTDTSFLTAVAPGNPSFSIYYPQNVGVFSMFDDLAGIDTGTLSYMVMGWYSNPDDDILSATKRGQTSYSDYLKSLRWTVDGNPATQASSSVYQGLALSFEWDRNGNPPAADPLQDIRDSGELNAAVGNTTIDAFSALTKQQLKAANYPTETINLLRAFQYDLLPIINQVNGDAILEETIRKAWFGSEQGGYRWEIIDAKSDGGSETDLTAAEATWLQQLNTDQQTLDTTLRNLFSSQWRFNSIWWKLGKDPDNMFPQSPPGVTNAKLEHELDPTNSAGVTSQLLAEFQKVNAVLKTVPQPVFAAGDTQQDSFQKGIDAFATAKGLTTGKSLKASATPRYWQPNNPVVVLSGIEPSPATQPNQTLATRLSTDLVTGFTVDAKTADASIIGSALPILPHLASLPAEAASLMTEFFFVDPANATAMATALNIPVTNITPVICSYSYTNYSNPLPSIGLKTWTQPWNPMYLEWKINYTHIPYLTGTNQNWTFDGQEYNYTPNGGSPATENRAIGGISLLSPNAQFIFGERLKDFLTKYPNADLSQLQDWIQQIDEWKILSQELTGMNDLLALRDPRAFRRPVLADTIGTTTKFSASELAGFPSDATSGSNVLPNANQGQVNTVPFLPNGPDVPFHGVRQGQFYFTELSLYDKFGRQLWIIESSNNSGLFDAKNFPLIRDAALTPTAAIDSTVAGVAQVPPRALQNARLDFDLADGKDQSKILGEDADVNPIGGWILPNHLDNGILIYAPDGTSLGEFRLFAQADSSKVGKWQAPPHNPSISSLADVAALAPLLKEMLDSAQIQVQANFETFLQVIDETLWTVDPLGNRDDQNLSVLVGRPLAVIRSRLQLNLHGNPYQDTSWSSTFAPPRPEFLDYNFSVRLGDQATRQDGVIGYFLGDDYSSFNSVTAPQSTASQNYIKQIGPIPSPSGGNFFNLQFKDSSSQYVTLLADPRASLHSITGILPIKKVDIPASFIEAALSKIEISFNMGPILTRIQNTPTQGGKVPAYTQVVDYPSPTEQNGSWSWWEKSATDGDPQTGYDLLKTSTTAELKDTPNTLREGILQLAIDLDEKP